MANEYYGREEDQISTNEVKQSRRFKYLVLPKGSEGLNEGGVSGAL